MQEQQTIYEVGLMTQLYDGYSEEDTENWIEINRVLTLPFVPFVGLYIGIDDAFHATWNRKVTAVTWGVEERRFSCNLSPLYFKGHYNFVAPDLIPPFEGWGELFKKGGWETVGPHPLVPDPLF